MVSNLTFDGYRNPFYTNLLHINGSLSIVFGILGMYLTLFKSPPIFGAYKYFLFNISFWAFSFDIYMSLLYSPKILFPALAICPQGILKTTSIVITHLCFVSRTPQFAELNPCFDSVDICHPFWVFVDRSLWSLCVSIRGIEK